MEDWWSVTEDQVHLLAVEGMVGALGYGPPGHLLAREGDQGLAAALATEVVQDENGVWLELREKQNKRKRKRQKHRRENNYHFRFMQRHNENTRGSHKAEEEQ